MTELTAVSTNGWFASEGYTVDLLTAVGTNGWYGITVEELISTFQTANFSLLVNRLEELGLEIQTTEDINPLEIMTSRSQTVTIKTIKNFGLKR